MSGLAPLSYKAEEPTQGSIAIGRYSGETAIAAGVYHYTKEDVLLNAAFGISGSEKMGRMGVSIRFGKSKDKDATVTTTTAPVTTPELKSAGMAISETKINLDEITVSQDDLKSEKAPV
ncbi:MAG: YadA C-terminal domain-containing protein [Negativicutes bacterium]|nr:YadA C-terminal domain-containing protein [Negativicutes bacterium]